MDQRWRGSRRQAAAHPPDENEQTLRTAAYLAPEQALGGSSDYRADIFSLGVVLYEMLTGRQPFADRTVAATVLRVAHETPAPPSRVNGAVPEELDAIVQRTLSKNLTTRHQSAASLAAELRSVATILDIRSGDREPPVVVPLRPARTRDRTLRWIVAVVAVAAGTAAWVWRAEAGDLWRRWVGPRVPAVIVVVPLESGDGVSLDTTGLTQDLTARLGQIAGLMIVGRSSVRSGQVDDPNELSRRTGAALMLSGLVLSEADRLVIDVELRQRDATRRLWGERFEGDVDRIFGLQTEIGESVARALGVPLEPSAARARKKAHLVDTRAYESYLAGLAARSQHETDRAVTLFEQAVALDNSLAEAHAGLAIALHARVADGAVGDTAQWRQRIREAARQALAVDPDLAQAHIAGGLAAETLIDALAHLRRAVELDLSSAEGYRQIARAIQDVDPSRAIAYFDYALRLDPGLTRARIGRMMALAHLERFDEARDEISRARIDDPGGTWWDGIAAMLSFAAQQFERGLAGVSDASHVETLPVLSVAYAGALQILGRPDDASSLARRATDRFPDFCDGRAMVAALAFASGDRVSAIRLADDIFVAAGRSDGTGGELRCAALAAAGIQDADRVATWVQRSIASEQALQAWTRPRYGVSPRVAWRRRWFPWNRVAERPVVREAARALEDAVGSLRAQVEHALDGLLEASPQISS